MSQESGVIGMRPNVPMSDAVNADTLSVEVKKLIDQGQIVHAALWHRHLTGAGLAETVRAFDQYRGTVTIARRPRREWWMDRT